MWYEDLLIPIYQLRSSKKICQAGLWDLCISFLMFFSSSRIKTRNKIYLQKLHNVVVQIAKQFTELELNISSHSSCSASPWDQHTFFRHLIIYVKYVKYIILICKMYLHKLIKCIFPNFQMIYRIRIEYFFTEQCQQADKLT